MRVAELVAITSIENKSPLRFNTESHREDQILEELFLTVRDECFLPVTVFRDGGFFLEFLAQEVKLDYLERIVIPRYKSVMAKHDVGGSVVVTCNNIARAHREGLVDCWFNVNLAQKYWEFEEKWEVPF